jgi:hypothetical protein
MRRSLGLAEVGALRPAAPDRRKLGNVVLAQRAFSQPWESVETGVGGGPTPGVTGSFATPFRASEGVIVLAEFIFN